MGAGLIVNPIAARTVSIVVGVILLALTTRGLKTGSAQLAHRFVSRQQHSVLYWAAVALSGAAGAFLVLGAVFPSLEGL